MKVHQRNLIFLISGNFIEFYDLTLYAFLAPILSKVFFPSANQSLSLLATLGVFTISYIARPIGAMYFGFMGDRVGRKRALCKTIIFTGLPTLIIALTPGYNTLGIISPIILILSRFIQGICAGGEFGGTTIFIMENFHSNNRGILSGFINSSIVGGMLLGITTSILSSLLTYENFWRIPFFLGASISILGYILRKRINENQFITSTIHKNYTNVKDFFKLHYKNFIYATLVSGFAGTMFYTSFVYPHLYFVTFKKWSFHYSLKICSINMVLYMILSPYAGSLVYKIGIKKMMLRWSTLSILLILPIFYLLNINSLLVIISALIILSILSSFFQACVNIFLVHLFPEEVRYRGVALSYCLGLALFGGPTIPLLMYLKGKELNSFMGLYIIFISLLAILGIYFSKLKFKVHINDKFLL